MSTPKVVWCLFKCVSHQSLLLVDTTRTTRLALGPLLARCFGLGATLRNTGRRRARWLPIESRQVTSLVIFAKSTNQRIDSTCQKVACGMPNLFISTPYVTCTFACSCRIKTGNMGVERMVQAGALKHNRCHKGTTIACHSICSRGTTRRKKAQRSTQTYQPQLIHKFHEYLQKTSIKDDQSSISGWRNPNSQRRSRSQIQSFVTLRSDSKQQFWASIPTFRLPICALCKKTSLRGKYRVIFPQLTLNQRLFTGLQLHLN